MFGLFKKSRPESSSFVAFDLKPLFNTLATNERAKFESLSNHLHLEIHRISTVMGFPNLRQSAIGKKKFQNPEIFSPNVAMMYLADPRFARSSLESFYPVEKFDSVRALEFMVNGREAPNEVLSIISGEAAVRVLRKDFYT
jgi:hypothetical protein